MFFNCVSLKEYNALVSQYEALEAELNTQASTLQNLEEDKTALENEYERLRADLESVITDLGELQEKYSAIKGGEASWEDYAQKAQIAYDKDDYPVAHEEFKNAVEAGSSDGVVWYRYAYSREQLFGLNQETIAAYETALLFLRDQYPDHKYVRYATSKLARVR